MKQNLRQYTLVTAISAVAGFAAITMSIANVSHTVSEKGKAFAPKDIEIALGDTVVFLNDDDTKHNISIRDLNYTSGLMVPGGQAQHIFDKAGKFKVRCGIHPKMKMTIVVK